MLSSEWISVKERVPAFDSTEVIGWTGKELVACSWYRDQWIVCLPGDDGSYYYGRDFLTHWIYAPDPPRQVVHFSQPQNPNNWDLP